MMQDEAAPPKEASEAKAVAAERKAHEERRVEKFAEERKAKEKEHEARSIAKLAKAVGRCASVVRVSGGRVSGRAERGVRAEL